MPTTELLLVAVADLAQQERRKLDRVFSDESKSMDSIPDRALLGSGEVQMYDS